MARLICTADTFYVTVVRQQQISQHRDLGAEQGGQKYSFKKCRQYQHLKIGPTSKPIIFRSPTQQLLLPSVIIWTSEAAALCRDIQQLKCRQSEPYVYWTLHHLDG